MSRNDSFYDSTRVTRPSQPAYLPPHLREYPNSSSSSFTPFHDSPGRFSRSPRGGGRGGRTGRGGGPPSGRGPVRDRSWPRSPRDNNVSGGGGVNQLAEKFDELEMVGEEVEANINAYDDTLVEATGDNIPPPVKSFSDVDFPNALIDNIQRCKYVKPTPIQRYAIPVAMEGRDLMACAQTGSGKTAAFCFPIISGIVKLKKDSTGPPKGLNNMASPLALILSPTRELTVQIHEEAKKFSHQTGVRVVVVYGGTSVIHQIRNLEKGVDILVATPGRLVDVIERSKVSLKNVKYLALDEADRMLDMGFEPQIRQIVQHMGMPVPGLRQTMLFSATFPTTIQRMAKDFLKDYIFLTAGKVGSSTDLILQKVEFMNDIDKRKHLINLLHTHRSNGNYGKHALTLIFVETKRGADALEEFLSTKGFPSIAIHGGKQQMERERALWSFRNGMTPTLVATDVASRGLDIPHVAHVINFDLPKEIDDYVHRIGRTGRAGKTGLATAFFTNKNSHLAKSLVELMIQANQIVPDWLTQYSDSSSSSYTGGRGNNHSYGNRKFGGYDYRADNRADYRADNRADNSYNYYYAPPAPTPQHHGNGMYSGFVNSGPVHSTYVVAPCNYGFDYGSVAATSGWD